MFTGRRLDPETGLYYYRARYYRPEIGRFLQPDPIGYTAGLNLYTYCLNNPANWIDPWGLWPEWLDNLSNRRNRDRLGLGQGDLTPEFRDELVHEGDNNNKGDKSNNRDGGGGDDDGGGGKRCPSDSTKDAGKDINDGKPPKYPAWKKNGPNWHNKDTGESLHPHPNDPDFGPHVDWHGGKPGKPEGRIFPDGSFRFK